MCTPDVKEALAEGSESFKDKAIRDEHQKKYSEFHQFVFYSTFR